MFASISHKRGHRGDYPAYLRMKQDRKRGIGNNGICISGLRELWANARIADSYVYIEVFSPDSN
jgi:hypothetical protein